MNEGNAGFVGLSCVIIYVLEMIVLFITECVYLGILMFRGDAFEIAKCYVIRENSLYCNRNSVRCGSES